MTLLTLIDNPVNQQIAIKFIKALKFQVSAVWNGREALEYLLKATSDDPVLKERCPLPSVILMDVQMPVLDGYNATHVLRHHSPYSTMEAIRRIPIIAMTASAIQGDQEKCERAGMDDYLAKPVKRPVLEKMIMKWIERELGPKSAAAATSNGIKPTLTRSDTDHSSNCPEHDTIATEWFSSRTPALQNLPIVGSPSKPIPIATAPRRTPAREPARRSSLSQSTMTTDIPGAANVVDSAMRKADLEERATALRDAKLMYATENEHGFSANSTLSPEVVTNGFERSLSFGSTGNSIPQSYPGQGSGGLALTKENVDMFNHELELGESAELPTAAAKAANVNPAMIPGPPPDLDIVVSSSPRRTKALLFGAQEDGSHLGVTVGSSNRQKRGDLGMLKADNRRTSDWSNSTAKPRRESAGAERLSP